MSSALRVPASSTITASGIVRSTLTAVLGAAAGGCGWFWVASASCSDPAVQSRATQPVIAICPDNEVLAAGA
jgi:hypothetical protein